MKYLIATAPTSYHYHLYAEDAPEVASGLHRTLCGRFLSGGGREWTAADRWRTCRVCRSAHRPATHRQGVRVYSLQMDGRTTDQIIVLTTRKVLQWAVNRARPMPRRMAARRIRSWRQTRAWSGGRARIALIYLPKWPHNIYEDANNQQTPGRER